MKFEEDYEKKTEENMQQYKEFANACRNYARFLSVQHNLPEVRVREVIRSAANNAILHEMLDV